MPALSSKSRIFIDLIESRDDSNDVSKLGEPFNLHSPNPQVVKRFRCWICGKKYEQLSNLDRHMLKKHVDNGNRIKTDEVDENEIQNSQKETIVKKPKVKKLAKQIPKRNDYKVRKTQITKGKELTKKIKATKKMAKNKIPIVNSTKANQDEIVALRKKSNKHNMCYLCFKFCQDNDDVIEHLIKKHRNEKLKCKKCRRVFKAHDDLEVHYLKIHMMITLEEPNESIEIEDSDENENVEAEIENILEKPMKNGKPTDCHVCGLILSSNKNLRRHINIHLKAATTTTEEANVSLDDFRCLKCAKVFKLQVALNIHSRKCN